MMLFHVRYDPATNIVLNLVGVCNGLAVRALEERAHVVVGQKIVRVLLKGPVEVHIALHAECVVQEVFPLEVPVTNER